MTTTYVLNQGQYTYTSSPYTYSNSQTNTSVNPVIRNEGMTYQAAGSMSFYEIRTNDSASGIYNSITNVFNRVLPIGTALVPDTEKYSILSNRENTAGYKLFLPESTTLTMDALYDYFVVIYSTETFNYNNILSHLKKTYIAKITEQISFDNANDGIEFSPKLPYEITKGTKFAVYRGPLKTDTSVVALAYGLLGEGIADGETRYDEAAIISTPTFYFYNDRVKTSNQLDYSTKYKLNRKRYQDESNTDSTVSIFLTQSQHGSKHVNIASGSPAQANINSSELKEYSPFTYNVVLKDNVAWYDRTVSGANTAFELDKTAFQTQSSEDYTFDHKVWDNCFRNVKRSSLNIPSTQLDGPNRHITYVDSHEKTNIFPHLIDLNVFTSISKSGTYAEARFADPNRILDVKVKDLDDFKVRNILFDETFYNNASSPLPGLAYYHDTNKVIIKGLTSKQSLSYYAGEPNYIVNAASGTNVEVIKINNYYYKIANVSDIGTLTLEKSTGLWTQILTVSHYRNENDGLWTAGGVQDNIKGDVYYRRKWSNITQNLLVDFNLNTNYTSTISLILKDREYSGNRITLSTINEDRKLIVPNNLPTQSYNPYNTNNYLDYFSGSFMVDKIVYNGSIEFKEDYIEDGQLKYLISGRDDIHKLLGPIVNKDYLHSQDIIYTSDSPIQKIITTTVKCNQMLEGTLGVYAVTAGTIDSTWVGKKIYRHGGELIGKVKSIVGGITLDAPARVKYSSSNGDGFLRIEDSNYLISGKGLSTHVDAINVANNLNHTSGKGIYFTGGLSLSGDNLQFSSATTGEYSLGYDINSIKNINQDNPFMFRLSDETSGTIKDVKTVSSLCNYNIISSIPQEGKDTIIRVAPTSPFILARTDNNSYDTRYTNSQGLYFLNLQGLDSGGLVNLVSSESTLSANSKKKSPTWTYKNSYFGTPIYRYTDLQTGSGGLFYQSFVTFPQTGKRSTNSIYAAKNSGLLSGYATAFKFIEGYTSTITTLPSLYQGQSSQTHGTPVASNLYEGPIESRGIYPVLGSNFADFTLYSTTDWRTWPLRKGTVYSGIDVGVTENAEGVYSNTNVVQREPNWVMPVDKAGTSFFTGFSADDFYDSIRASKQSLEIIDPKAIGYHIFSPCDSESESMNVDRHIGYSTNDFKFKDFNILLMSEPVSESNTISTHEHYVGSLQSKARVNESYQTLPITSSNIQPKDMKRFSLGRLIEVGFDFHFNQIDLENPTIENYDTNNNDYTKFRMAEKTPVKVMKTAAIGSDEIWISSGNWFKMCSWEIGAANANVDQYDKSFKYKYSTNIDYIFDAAGNFLGIPHSQSIGEVTTQITGNTMTLEVNSLPSGSTDAVYIINYPGANIDVVDNVTGSSGSDGVNDPEYTTSGDGTGINIYFELGTDAIVGAQFQGVGGSNFRAGDTITVSSSIIGGTAPLIFNVRSINLGNKLTFYSTSNNNELNTFPDNTKGIIFNNKKRGSALQYANTGYEKLLFAVTAGDTLYAMRYEVPYIDVKHKFKFLGFSEDSLLPQRDNKMNLMRFSLRNEIGLKGDARDSSIEDDRIFSEERLALQTSGGSLTNHDSPGHIINVELLPYLDGRTRNGSAIANSTTTFTSNAVSTTDSPFRHLGVIYRAGYISGNTSAVRTGIVNGQISSFTTPYEFTYDIEYNSSTTVTSLKITSLNGGNDPTASGDSFAPLEIGDRLTFTGSYWDSYNQVVHLDDHPNLDIIVDAEFLRQYSAGKISGRQNGTFGTSRHHDTYWSGSDFWSHGSTELKGGIPGADTPRLNCPLVFDTYQLWDDLEFKFIEQIGIDWNDVGKGRRILSPFYHAQHYIKKDTTYKNGNYCGFPFDENNKTHSTIGGLREATDVIILSATDKGTTSAISTSVAHSGLNIGMTLAIWADVDEPIIVGKITGLGTTTITFGGGTQVKLKALEPLYKVGIIPIQYWHPSRVIAGMSSAHQDMPMYGYRGASEPYGIYGTAGTTMLTGGSPKLSSAMYQGGFFVIFKTYSVENSDLPSYKAGSSFKLGTDGYTHKSTTGSGTSYQSDVFSGKYSQVYTYYSDRNTPTWAMPIFPVHFLTYPGIFSDNFKNSLTYNESNFYGSAKYLDVRTDLDIGTSANHPSSAYNTDIFTKGRAKADFVNVGDNNIGKTNLGIFTGYKPQVYLCTGGSITVGGADAFGRRELVFDMDGNNDNYSAINSWLHFAPNLTGYYLVSNESMDGIFGLPTIWDNYPVRGALNIPREEHIPKYIHQILDHKIAGWTDGIAQHSLIIDNAVSVSEGTFDYTQGRTIAGNICGYRLMKLSETCLYKETPDKFNLYSMDRTLSKLPFEDKMYSGIDRLNTATGDEDGNNYKASEGGRTNINDGVYSMYVILDAESDNSNYTMYRDFNKFISKWPVNITHDMFITDGTNKTETSMILHNQDMTTDNEDDISTLISSARPVSLSINNDKKLRGLVSFGEIFNITVPSTFNLNSYTQAKIGSTFNIGSDVDDVINDLMEINNITYTKKDTTERYIVSPNIKGADLYNSLLSVSRLKGLEPRVNGKIIEIKKKDDSDDITDITITEGVSKVSVSKRNKSSFDLFNEIKVYGDGFSSTKRNSSSIKLKGKKTLEETDLDLITLKQVDDRARDLLKLHTKGLNQIELNLGITGLEYLEVGKIIKVDYPSEHIPVGKYLILEINYAIGKPLNLVLGFFTKNLDYRIGELITANKKVNANLRGNRYSVYENTDTIIENVRVRELRIEVVSNTFNYITTGITTVSGTTNPIGTTTLNVNWSGDPNILAGTMLYTTNGELVGTVASLNYPTIPGQITLNSGISFIIYGDAELVSGGSSATFGLSNNFSLTSKYGFLGTSVEVITQIEYQENLV